MSETTHMFLKKLSRNGEFFNSYYFSFGSFFFTFLFLASIALDMVFTGLYGFLSGSFP